MEIIRCFNIFQKYFKIGIVRYFKMFPFSVRRDRFANEIQVEKEKNIR